MSEIRIKFNTCPRFKRGARNLGSTNEISAIGFEKFKQEKNLKQANRKTRIDYLKIQGKIFERLGALSEI